MSGETQVPTQGRWVIGPMYSYIASDPLDQQAGNNGGYVICQLFGPDAPANAKLFMASRKLLDACRGFVEEYGLRCGPADDLDPAADQAPVVAAAMRAIAEATGELP